MTKQYKKEGTKVDRLLEFFFLLLNSSANIPYSHFLDEKWGVDRTVKRLVDDINNSWFRYRGQPLCEIVDSSGNKTERGERFIRLVDRNINFDIGNARRLSSLRALVEFGRLVKGSALGIEYGSLLDALLGEVGKDLKKKEQRLLHAFERKFFYVGKGMKDYASGVPRDIFDDVYSALLVEQYIEVTTHNDETHILKPLSIVMFNNGLYLVCLFKDQEDDSKPYIYKIESFKSSKILRNEKFTYPVNFDPQKLFEGGFGLILGDKSKMTEVVLEFSKNKKVQTYVRERRWTPVDQYEPQKNGKLRMTFRVTDLTEVKSFVLSFGSDVEVIRPASFREDVLGTVAKMGQLYDDGKAA